MFLYDIGKSLYDVTDSNELSELYELLYNVPAIIAQERKQRKRKSSAFKRYIEFRILEEYNYVNQNESRIDHIQEAQTEGGRILIDFFFSIFILLNLN